MTIRLRIGRAALASPGGHIDTASEGDLPQEYGVNRMRTMFVDECVGRSVVRPGSAT